MSRLKEVMEPNEKKEKELENDEMEIKKKMTYTVNLSEHEMIVLEAALQYFSSEATDLVENYKKEAEKLLENVKVARGK